MYDNVLREVYIHFTYYCPYSCFIHKDVMYRISEIYKR